MGILKGLISKVFALAIALGLVIINPETSHAFASVLGTKVVGEQGVSVDGNLVEDPNTAVVADSDKPTFSGYTISNSEVLLIINSDPIEVGTDSDANGYWHYTMDASLEAGQHTLALKVTDSKGAESDKTLVATFIIPEVKGSKTSIMVGDAPLPKISKLNYLSISLVVLGSLILLGVIYAFINRRPR